MRTSLNKASSLGSSVPLRFGSMAFRFRLHFSDLNEQRPPLQFDCWCQLRQLRHPRFRRLSDFSSTCAFPTLAPLLLFPGFREPVNDEDFCRREPKSAAARDRRQVGCAMDRGAPKNVEFHPSPASWPSAGNRSSKCDPHQPGGWEGSIGLDDGGGSIHLQWRIYQASTRTTGAPVPV